jgi:ribonuclease G
VQTEILVTVAPQGTRVAIVENKRLAELLVERGQEVVGNIYKGRVADVVPGLDAAFVDCGMDKNVFLHVSDAVPYDPVKNPNGRLPKIAEVVQEGEEIIVQVTKGPLESKGARATTRLSLPARTVVLIRDAYGGVGVSRKIEDEQERQRLRELAGKLKPAGWGLIVRTRAQGASRRDLQRDLGFLLRTWRSIERRARQAKAPALLYEDPGVVFELLRDVVDQQVQRLVIDHQPTYQRVLKLLGQMGLTDKVAVELYEEDEPLFVRYGIERELERALHPRVWLPHGGHISIMQTEALTAIDVNSGRFTATSSLADTVLRTNLEAAEEVARQLRLRDIGGIIVIDFIDMEKPHHRERVLETFRRAVARDRMRTRVMHITPLGLLEMTRKRTNVSLSHTLQDPCPYCHGTGRLLSAMAMAERVVAELRLLACERQDEAWAVVAEPRVAWALVGPGGEWAAYLEQQVRRPVLIRADPTLHREQYQITSGALADLEQQFGFLVPGDILEIAPSQAVQATDTYLLAVVRGVLVEVPDAPVALAAPVRVRLLKVERSYARGTLAQK